MGVDGLLIEEKYSGLLFFGFYLMCLYSYNTSRPTHLTSPDACCSLCLRPKGLLHHEVSLGVRLPCTPGSQATQYLAPCVGMFHRNIPPAFASGRVQNDDRDVCCQEETSSREVTPEAPFPFIAFCLFGIRPGDQCGIACITTCIILIRAHR